MTKTIAPQSPTRLPWNRGRIVGPKPPLKPKHIWAIRTRLQHDGHIRDLAMFNVAIDSKLRGCDLVKLRVSDVHLGEGVRLRTTIVQQTGIEIFASATSRGCRVTLVDVAPRVVTPGLSAALWLGTWSHPGLRGTGVPRIGRLLLKSA